MPDIVAIGAVLGSIKSATDIAKLIKDSGSSLEEAEIKLQVAELIGNLADAKIQVASIQSEIIEKDKIIQHLNEVIDTKNKVEWEKPYYWVVEAGERDGPFCQRCYDIDKNLVRLQGGANGRWGCRACDKSYTDKSYKKPNISSRTVGGF